MADRVGREIPLQRANLFQNKCVPGAIELRDLNYGNALGVRHDLGECRRHVDVGVRPGRPTQTDER
jgi:hypothetical protein